MRKSVSVLFALAATSLIAIAPDTALSQAAPKPLVLKG